MNSNSQCPWCGKYFNHLGLASHRARCREKMMCEKNKQQELAIENVTIADNHKTAIIIILLPFAVIGAYVVLLMVALRMGALYPERTK